MSRESSGPDRFAEDAHPLRVSRRRVFGHGAGLAGLAAMVACGLPGSSNAKPAASGTGCRSTIEVWGYGIGGDTMKQLVADFTAKHATCNVVATDQADDAQGTVQTKLTTAQVGGAPPALTGLSPSRFRTWTDAGLVQEVDDLFK